jgi:hypothetical protein
MPAQHRQNMKLPNSVVAVSLAVLGLAAASLHAATRPSKISAFGGPCPGGITISSSGLSLSGSTQGSFSTSKVREIGTLSLTSTLSQGGSATFWSEKYQFNKRSLTYTISVSTGAAIGTGTAHISAHAITYSAGFVFAGIPYTIQGTIRQTKHRIFVDEILTGNGSSAPIDYVLRRPGKH